ncbi:uncharacterized protein I303_106576 [Kwoniella dejecticola CBS 10117]|uniref:Phosphatidylinositol glycan, class S n=1 Tax=Kwoniella dejecticola CBS 10117 TaxID=1296121 RepID=A0A1A5ZUB0_9TREE|nr:uncharacterized protein I303_08167 [Kwoniella dejecticola CBS 10117]OBR81397.1 hypothetical protein I303_08167 [Kwoniella dejecticola CBS 10117]
MSISSPLSDMAGPSTAARGNGTVLKPGPSPTPMEVTQSINPPNKKRLFILLSFPLLFLLAIPFWWYTTSIERLSLPIQRIDELDSIGIPAYRGKILITSDKDAFPTPPPGRAVFETKVILQALGKIVTEGVDGIYERSRPQKKRNWDLIYEGDDTKIEKTTPFRVHLRRFQHANTSFPLEPYVQPHETGLMTSGIRPGTLVIPVHPDQVGDRFLKQHYKIALINSILSLYPADPPAIPLRALKYSPNITLSFVLLNEDSSAGSYVRSWDIDGAIQEHFVPHLEPLKDIFNFTIESQILYHAPLTFDPTLTDAAARSVNENQTDIQVEQAIEEAKHGDENAEQVAKELLQREKEQFWKVSEEDMKVFVNSERWSLDSGSTNNPVLRFLLYIPKEGHRPMRLATVDGAQSFLLPQFGSVHILNPPSLLSSSSVSATSYHLPGTALKPSFHLFTQHLYALLALPTLYEKGKIHLPPPSSPLLPRNEIWQGITPWQMHQILDSRTRENTEEAKKTLVGIKRLVLKIKEMKFGENVRSKVIGSIENLEKISESNSPLENFILSRDAVNLANQAFFDPSMMGLLYFPDEHKFAVYTPLFAPIAVPLLLGLLKELISWRKGRSAKNKAKAEAEAENTDGAAKPEEAIDPITASSEKSDEIQESRPDESNLAGEDLDRATRQVGSEILLEPKSTVDIEPEASNGRVLRSRSKG